MRLMLNWCWFYTNQYKKVIYSEPLVATLSLQGGEDLLIADISMPRGGHFVSGYASHQIGLDVDIWFRLAAKLLTVKQREAPLR